MAMFYDPLKLVEAIDKADAKVLRAVVKSICKESDAFGRQAARHLLVTVQPVNGTKRKSSDEEDASQIANKKSMPTEVTASRYELCMTCNQVFDVSQNFKDACKTHEEDAEPDEDYFPDDDEIRHDRYSARDWTKDWQFKQCPEGFIYECCDRNATEVPCVVQRHIATDPSVRSALQQTESSDEEDGEDDEDDDEDEYGSEDDDD